MGPRIKEEGGARGAVGNPRRLHAASRYFRSTRMSQAERCMRGHLHFDLTKDVPVMTGELAFSDYEFEMERLEKDLEFELEFAQAEEIERLRVALRSAIHQARIWKSIACSTK
jgi:hypothetical protein